MDGQGSHARLSQQDKRSNKGGHIIPAKERYRLDSDTLMGLRCLPKCFQALAMVKKTDCRASPRSALPNKNGPIFDVPMIVKLTPQRVPNWVPTNLSAAARVPPLHGLHQVTWCSPSESVTDRTIG
eukprot:1155102-Pelagomonas_calceolata.AAC.9